MKTFHFIGIAGSAIAPLAIMLKKKGYNVTGSEHNKVWDPAKTLLETNNIEYTELEYDMENVKNADIVVIGGSALLKDAKHPEFLKAKELNKKIVGYAYVVKNFITKENSFVVTGSYGKTTITSALMQIFTDADKNPSFMVGGKPLGFEKGVKSTDSNISIVEGDEYASAWGFDMEPRFTHYNPTHAIITSAEWDHIDVYPTLKKYINAFQKLGKIVENNKGFLLVNAEGENIKEAIENYSGKLASYSVNNKNTLDTEIFYSVKNIKYKGNLTIFEVFKNNSPIGKFEAQLYGKHNIENLLTAIAISNEYELPIQDIKKGIKSFQGVSRRLEPLGKLTTGAQVIDDFAHSPVKAEATLNALKERFPTKRIIGVYEPRISIHQNRKVLSLYPGVFDAADMIFITKLIHHSETANKDKIRGKDLLDIVTKTQPNARYAVKTEIISEYLNNKTDENSIVVLMSASSWNELLSQLKFQS